MDSNELRSVVFATVAAMRDEYTDAIVDAVYADPLFANAIRDGGRVNDELDTAIAEALTAYNAWDRYDPSRVVMLRVRLG